jgi:eukaryotic-like serine/threonine-protein kinase
MTHPWLNEHPDDPPDKHVKRAIIADDSLQTIDVALEDEREPSAHIEMESDEDSTSPPMIEPEEMPSGEALRLLLMRNEEEIKAKRTLSCSIIHGERAPSSGLNSSGFSMSMIGDQTIDYLMEDVLGLDLRENPDRDGISFPIGESSSVYEALSSQGEHHLSEDLYGLKPAQVSIYVEGADDSAKQERGKIDLQVSSMIGEGGMGQIFLGRQSSLNREIALKVAKSQGKDPRLLAQVCHEAQVTAGLDHPNILPIYLLARSSDGQPIQVMKRIEGVSWHELLYTEHHPLWEELNLFKDRLRFHLDILAQVSQAINYAHKRGIIHRDLKPENVMIGRFGEVYVLDWGVAIDLNTARGEESAFIAQTESGVAGALIGTPAYMPPEMARQAVEEQGPWSDVYLLGAILYELLIGSRLHQGRTHQELFQKIMDGALPTLPTTLVKEMKDLLQAALMANPKQRLSHAGAFRVLLLEAIRNSRSRDIERKGWASLRQLQRASQPLSESSSPQLTSAALESLYEQAKHSFWTALEMWPMNKEAESGMDQSTKLWARALLAMGETLSAERLLNELHVPDKELEVEITFAKINHDQEEFEHQALRDWRKGEDLSMSRTLRLMLARVGLLFFGVGSLTLDLLERFHWIKMDAKSEFFVSLALTLLVIFSFMIYSQSGHKEDLANNMFIRLKRFLMIVLSAVAINRFIGWRVNEDFQNILLHEMPLIMVGCYGMSTLSGQQDFSWGVISFGIATFASLLWPHWLTLFYALAMISLWVGVLYNWRIEPKRG